MGRKIKRKHFKNGFNQQTFSIFGSNANGIRGKVDSLKNALAYFKNPSCINLQETKLRFKGTIQLEGYQIFENIRKGFGGGLLTAIDKDLKPVLISAGNDDVEMIVVQVAIGDKQIRILG